MVSKVRQSSNVETPKEGVAMCSYLRKCVLSLILIGDDIFSAHMMKHCHSLVEVNDSSINLALCLYPQLITLQTYILPIGLCLFDANVYIFSFAS
jgi:hypothetical protein